MRPAEARVVPTWTEPDAAASSALIGGPLGRHALVGRSRFWTPLRIALLGAVLVLAMGWLLKAPCLQRYPDSDGHLALDWQGNRQYVSMCYSDTVTLYADHHLAAGELPYRTHWETTEEGQPPRTHFMDYPVVTGFFLWATARLAGRYQASAGPAALPTALPEVIFFNITAAFLAAAWLVVVWTVRRQRSVRPWDAALVAISPLALLHLFTGADALAVAASAGGLYAFARGRSALAGALIGLAAAAKVYAILLVVPLLLVSWRRRRDGWAGLVPTTGSAAAKAAVAAGVTWLVLNAPVALLYTQGWLEFFRTVSRAGPGADSVYFALSYFTGWPGFDGQLAAGQTPFVLNAVTLLLLVAGWVGVGVLAARAPRPPRLASLCFLVVAGALLVSKTWSPQFSLWLVPLAVLALPRWRLLLVWMAVDAVVWVPRMYYYLGVENKGLPPDVFLATVLVRDAVVVLLAVLVVRSVLRPETDPVRILGADDPDWPASYAGPTRERSARSGAPVSVG